MSMLALTRKYLVFETAYKSATQLGEVDKLRSDDFFCIPAAQATLHPSLPVTSGVLAASCSMTSSRANAAAIVSYTVVGPYAWSPLHSHFASHHTHLAASCRRTFWLMQACSLQHSMRNVCVIVNHVVVEIHAR